MREGGICVSPVTITCPLWALSHLSSFALTTIAQNHNTWMIYKRSDRIFGMSERQSKENFRSNIFFYCRCLSYLNSNGIRHLSLNYRERIINPFEQSSGIICCIFIWWYRICLRCLNCSQFRFRRDTCDHTFHVQSCMGIMLVEHSSKECFSVFTYRFLNLVSVVILHDLYYQRNRY